MVWFCKRADALPGLLLPRITPHIRRLLKLIAPAALGAGVAQINLLIDVTLATNFKEGVSYLYYADRINELPIGVIGVAVGTALLPMITRQLREQKIDAARHSFNRAIELVLLFGIPACAALLAIPQVIIRVLYEHGEFSASDTTATYTAMMAFAAGLPAFLLVKVLAPGFYANEDTKTPFYIATACVVINLILNLILMQFYEHVGLAMATSIAGWVNAIAMAVILHKREMLQLDGDARRRLPRIVISAACMFVFLVLVASALDDWLHGETIYKTGGLMILVGGGGGIYGVLILLLKVYDLGELKQQLKLKGK